MANDGRLEEQAKLSWKAARPDLTNNPAFVDYNIGMYAAYNGLLSPEELANFNNDAEFSAFKDPSSSLIFLTESLKGFARSTSQPITIKNLIEGSNAEESGLRRVFGSFMSEDTMRSVFGEDGSLSHIFSIKGTPHEAKALKILGLNSADELENFAFDVHNENHLHVLTNLVLKAAHGALSDNLTFYSKKQVLGKTRPVEPQHPEILDAKNPLLEYGERIDRQHIYGRNVVRDHNVDIDNNFHLGNLRFINHHVNQAAAISGYISRLSPENLAEKLGIQTEQAGEIIQAFAELSVPPWEEKISFEPGQNVDLLDYWSNDQAQYLAQFKNLFKLNNTGALFDLITEDAKLVDDETYLKTSHTTAQDRRRDNDPRQTEHFISEFKNDLPRYIKNVDSILAINTITVPQSHLQDNFEVVSGFLRNQTYIMRGYGNVPYELYDDIHDPLFIASLRSIESLPENIRDTVKQNFFNETGIDYDIAVHSLDLEKENPEKIKALHDHNYNQILELMRDNAEDLGITEDLSDVKSFKDPKFLDAYQKTMSAFQVWRGVPENEASGFILDKTIQDPFTGAPLPASSLIDGYIAHRGQNPSKTGYMYQLGDQMMGITAATPLFLYEVYQAANLKALLGDEHYRTDFTDDEISLIAFKANLKQFLENAGIDVPSDIMDGILDDPANPMDPEFAAALALLDVHNAKILDTSTGQSLPFNGITLSPTRSSITALANIEQPSDAELAKRSPEERDFYNFISSLPDSMTSGSDWKSTSIEQRNNTLLGIASALSMQDNPSERDQALVNGIAQSSSFTSLEGIPPAFSLTVGSMISKMKEDQSSPLYTALDQIDKAQAASASNNPNTSTTGPETKGTGDTEKSSNTDYKAMPGAESSGGTAGKTTGGEPSADAAMRSQLDYSGQENVDPRRDPALFTMRIKELQAALNEEQTGEYADVKDFVSKYLSKWHAERMDIANEDIILEFSDGESFKVARDGNIYEFDKDLGDYQSVPIANITDAGTIEDADPTHSLAQKLMVAVLADDKTLNLYKDQRYRAFEDRQRDILAQNGVQGDSGYTRNLLNDINKETTRTKFNQDLKKYFPDSAMDEATFANLSSALWIEAQRMRAYAHQPDFKDIRDNPQNYRDFHVKAAVHDLVTYNTTGVMPNTVEILTNPQYDSEMVIDDRFFAPEVYTQLDKQGYYTDTQGLLGPAGQEYSEADINKKALEIFKERAHMLGIAPDENGGYSNVTAAMFEGRFNPYFEDFRMAMEGMASLDDITAGDINSRFLARIQEWNPSARNFDLYNPSVIADLQAKGQLPADADLRDPSLLDQLLEKGLITENTKILNNSFVQEYSSEFTNRLAYARNQRWNEEFGSVRDMGTVKTMVNGEWVNRTPQDMMLRQLIRLEGARFYSNLPETVKHDPMMTYEELAETLKDRPDLLAAIDYQIDHLMDDQSVFRHFDLPSGEASAFNLTNDYYAMRKNGAYFGDVGMFVHSYEGETIYQSTEARRAQTNNPASAEEKTAQMKENTAEVTIAKNQPPPEVVKAPESTVQSTPPQ